MEASNQQTALRRLTPAWVPQAPGVCLIQPCDSLRSIRVAMTWRRAAIQDRRRRARLAYQRRPFWKTLDQSS
jgi:hypothetical protein